MMQVRCRQVDTTGANARASAARTLLPVTSDSHREAREMEAGSTHNMVPGTLSGRSRHGASAVRSHRSSMDSKRRVRREEDAKHREGVAKPVQLDLDELREKRAVYFGKPLAERQKVIRVRSSPVAVKSSKSKGADKEGQRKRRSHAVRSSESSSSKSRNRNDLDNGEYVYAARATQREQVPRPAAGDDRQSARLEDRRKPRYERDLNDDSNLDELDSVVTPDDSISVVAEKRASSARHSALSSRSHLKRSSTTSSPLAPIAEVDRDSSSIPKRRSSKRDSALLRGLLRRRSTTSVPTSPRLVECLTCGSDDIPHGRSAKLACGHRMCHDCLKRVFEMSVTDPAHMPPKCCTDEHIPLRHVDKLFDLKFKVLWNRKYQEYNTKNRIYCPSPRCGEWIKPSYIHRDSHGRKYAHCPRCRTKVCTHCNNKMHRSRDCPKDPEIVKLVEQAKEKGWQRCYSCNSMVELKEGCNHMTCRCLAEFCMCCGARWKTCVCPWFQYTNLQNPDRLNDMRVPEPIQVIYRRVFGAVNPNPPPQLAQQPPAPQAEMTYQQEIEQRRQQERLDADLARRLQLASLLESDEQPPRRSHRDETWGLGNAAGHFMNENFVQNAANVVMNAFGDANMGRRGERTSGRRRRARPSDQNGEDAGLAPNFLGDESVLGVGPSRSARAPV